MHMFECSYRFKGEAGIARRAIVSINNPDDLTPNGISYVIASNQMRRAIDVIDLCFICLKNDYSHFYALP